MKHITFILLFCFCQIVSLHGFQISQKYGNITNEELNMKVYERDTSAAAVVLYDKVFSNLIYDQKGNLTVNTIFKKKIKIFKKEGIKYATIQLPFYYLNKENGDKVTLIEAKSYHLKKNKKVSSGIYTYSIDQQQTQAAFFSNDYNNFRQVKFTIPKVEEGSVIEYKVEFSSSEIFKLADWRAQMDIPVINFKYETASNKPLNYLISTKGNTPVEILNAEDETADLQISSDTIKDFTTKGQNIIITIKDIPALKKESHLWCLDDYYSSIDMIINSLELQSKDMSLSSKTWQELETKLGEKKDFITNIQFVNPFYEIKKILKNITDEDQKIALIYNFIKNYIEWDKTYSFDCKNFGESVLKGTGNNAQINILLMGALKEAGIKTYPILICRRSKGRFSLKHPSLSKLNTFIVAVEKSDSTVTYLDGSAIYGGPNTLPLDLMVDRGYVFEPNRTEKWVDLTHLAKNEQASNTTAELDQNGNMKGQTTTTFTNQKAYDYRSTFAAAKDSSSYIRKIQDSCKIKVLGFILIGKEPIHNTLKEQLSFIKTIQKDENRLYINPMIIPHITKNEFTQTERELPIELDYPYSYHSTLTITIPENYEIESLPKSMETDLNKTDGTFSYQLKQSNNTLQLEYRFSLNKIIFPNTDYPAISDFYGRIAAKNAERIVLKKKQSL